MAGSYGTSATVRGVGGRQRHSPIRRSRGEGIVDLNSSMPLLRFPRFPSRLTCELEPFDES